jgi:predicted DNA-binding transcriptional regulator AlpA
MVRLRKVPNSFAPITVKSEGALSAYKAISNEAPNAEIAVPKKHNGPQQEPSRSAKRLLSWPQVEDRIPFSRTTAWRRMREGAFPRPIRISKGRVAWIEDEIVSWINQHVEAANTS